MKTISQIALLTTLGTCLLLSACVTKKKYALSNNRANRLQSDSILTHNQFYECKARFKN
jgi:hypothetical protein